MMKRLACLSALAAFMTLGCDYARVDDNAERTRVTVEKQAIQEDAEAAFEEAKQGAAEVVEDVQAAGDEATDRLDEAAEALQGDSNQ